MTTTARSRAFNPDLSGRSALDTVGLVAGIAVPFLSALIYRSYELHLTPQWLEMTRQMGLPFILAEVWFIQRARRRGFDPAETIRALTPWMRAALGVLLATFWLSSAFVSQDPPLSIAFSLFWVVHLLFGAAVHHRMLSEPDPPVERFGAAFGLGLLATVPVIALHFGNPPIPPDLVEWDAAVPGYTSVRLFGAWAAMALALLLGIAWNRRWRDTDRPWLHPAIALAAGLAFWTGTRAAVMATVAVLLMARVFAGRPASRSFVPRALLWIVPACVVAAALVPYGHPSYMMIESGEYGTAFKASGGRTMFWGALLELIAQRPLFGWGAASGAWLITVPGMNHYQPHNVVLQLLLHSGAVAAVAGLALLASATWRVHAALLRDRALLPLVMMLDSLLVIGLVDGTFHFDRFCLMITALFGACLARGRAAAA